MNPTVERINREAAERREREHLATCAGCQSHAKDDEVDAAPFEAQPPVGHDDDSDVGEVE